MFIMFFHINPIKAQAKAEIKAAGKIQFDTVAKVAGIKQMTIFVQDTKMVVMPDGSKAIVAVCHSSNEAFIKENGSRFLIVGKSFLKMSHREQIAHVYNVLSQVASNLQISNTMDEIESDCRRNLVMENDTFRYTVSEDVEIKGDGAVRRYLKLAQLFGEKAARHVVMDSIKLSMKSSKLHAQAVAKSAKVDKVTYCAKDFKDEIKASKKSNAEAIKAHKAEAKAEKKAAKAKQPDLEAEAEAIPTEQPQGQPA